MGTLVQSRDPSVARTLAAVGYDFVIADLEQVSDVEAIVRACAAHEVAVLCRLAPSSLGRFGALLDAGAAGIQVSDVSSVSVAEMARDAASREHAVLVGQIESAAGLANLDSIVVSEIFDALFIGSADLSVPLGHPGDVWHPSVLTALKKAGETILGGGTTFGICCADAEAALHWARRGACMLTLSSDLSLLSSAAEAMVRQFREDL